MADDSPVNFTKGAAKKVVDAVKAWQREPSDLTGRRRSAVRSAEETCFAKLTNRVDDGWEWNEVYRKRTAEASGGTPATYSWEAVENGRKGDDSQSDEENKNLAFDLWPDSPGVGVEGEVYLLRRAAIFKDADEGAGTPAKWIPGWAIAAPSRDERLKIVGLTSGAGAKYTAYRIYLATADIPATGDATASDVGSTITTSVMVIDTNEIGRPHHSHLLDVGQIVSAWHLRTNSDGTTVYECRAAPRDGETFGVALSQSGGSDGDASTAASWTYLVTAPNGEDLTGGTPIGPVDYGNRPWGKCIPASYGIAWYAGSALNFIAHETYGTGGCPSS